MPKFYYENKVQNQNITAKSNVVWAADITDLELAEGGKFYVFLCLDIHTNTVIAHATSKKTITTKAVVASLEKAIRKRFFMQPQNPVILHTDRGTQFSSKSYNDFLNKHEKYVVGSMSRPDTPTDNPVAERYMRTFKEHKYFQAFKEHEIDNKTLQECIFCELEKTLEIKPSRCRQIVNMYIEDLNKTRNTKSSVKTPERKDKDVSIASMLMAEPKYRKAFSDRYRPDPRRTHIDKYEVESTEVTSILEEFAAQKAEIVAETPFDRVDFETTLAFKMFDKRLAEVYDLIAQSPEMTRACVEETIAPIADSIDELHTKVDILLPKKKRLKNVRQLRDPVERDLFPIFMANAGNCYTRHHEIKRAQLRIAYTILYYVGLRINEMRNLTQENIEKAISSSQLSLIHYKTNEPHIHVLSKSAVQDLKELELEYKVVFEKYKYKFLFGKEEPVNKRSLIRFVNKDLAYTCKIADIPYNIKSHSFRINVISSLLKVTSVQNTADIIGHHDVRSTMSYKRYALSKTEIQDLLEQIHQTKIEGELNT